MTAAPLYRFPAQMESLEAMLAHVKAACSGTEPAAALRAETAVEELLTNSVVHGAAGRNTQTPVWLAVKASGEALKLRYEDAFEAFDPTSKIQQALEQTSNPIEQRAIGGLGLLMVYRLADEFRYVRENERNRTDLSFRGRGPRAQR